MSRTLRTVLFDLDGTLLDSIRLILDSYHHALEVHRLPARTDEEWLAGIGTPLRVQFGPWAHEPALFNALVETYRDYNLAHHDARVTGYPGAVELVRGIRALGVRTGLVTSKQRTGAIRGLERLGLVGDMDVVIAADDVTKPKPDPEPVLLALEQLGEDPAGSMYVGDSVHDMECGWKAGVATVAVLWGPFTRTHLESSRPTYWVETPQDLIELVKSQTGLADQADRVG
jgi:pyrophosphatase PpaX